MRIGPARGRLAARVAAVTVTTALTIGTVLAVPAFAGPADAAAKERTACPASYARIACVSLTQQRMWVQERGRITFGPVPVRTGRTGFATRIGLQRIYMRAADHWSTLYDVAMPYSQFFNGGIAFHGIDGSVYSPPGSHGCVNLKLKDARALWTVTRIGDPVYVFGQKPGT